MARSEGAPTQRRPVRQYHFHVPGVFYVAVTLFVAVGALNSQNNLLFGALGLAIGGLLVSGILSGASLMRLRIERDPPVGAAVGEPMTLRYSVTNGNRLIPAFGLTIEEIYDDASSRKGAGRLRPGRAFAPHIAPRQTLRCAAGVLCLRRGEVELKAVRIWTTFPFGLARKSVTYEIPATVVVRPADLVLRESIIERATARSTSGAGAERAAGSGEEFYGLREYSSGDASSRIAWRRSARTGELVVRQHAVPSPARLWVIIRLGGGPTEAAAEAAIVIAAGILTIAHERGVAVGLCVPGARIMIAPGLENRQLSRLLTALAVARYSGEGDAFPARAARAGGCMVVHAAGIDTSFGPAHAHHIAADRLADLAVSKEDAQRVLELLSASKGDSVRRRWWRLGGGSAA